MRRSITLLGIPIDAVTEAEAVAGILDDVNAGRGAWVVTPNLDILRQVHRTPALRELISNATWTLPDGMPLVWAARLKGTPIPERVAGSSLVYPLCVEASRQKMSVFLLGGNPGAGAAAALRLENHAPGLNVVGVHCPPVGFEHDPEELARMHHAVVEARPDLVLVALGFPKQEIVVAELRRHLPGAAYLGVGVTLSFIAGDVARAPAWMQRGGLEWLHRLVHEPRRLFRRYIIQGAPFALRLFASAALERGQRPPLKAFSDR